MGNIQGWGSPLSLSFLSEQSSLQHLILTRQRELGMSSVLPAFAGHVPSSFASLFPNASITKSPNWGNFPPQYCCDSLLSPTDPLFQTTGTLFTRILIDNFGTDHIYNGDTFNEMDPASDDPEYLRSCSYAVWAALVSVDPKAVWLMQDWLFQSGWWTSQNIANYLSGVPKDGMLILDLTSDQSPFWESLLENDKNWIWCLLHNYGGQRNLYGNLSLISTQPLIDFPNSEGTMVGTGITMEAIEQNPIVYELMNEMGWRSRSFDLSEWIDQYIVRRYGGVSESASQAWSLLLNGQYQYPFNWAAQSLMVLSPSISMDLYEGSNATSLVTTWRLLLQSVSEMKNGKIQNDFLSSSSSASSLPTDPFLYDLVDVTRQSLSNLFADLHAATVSMWRDCAPPDRDDFSLFIKGKELKSRRLHPKFKMTKLMESHHMMRIPQNRRNVSIGSEELSLCLSRVSSLQSAVLGVFVDMDEILGTNVNYLLGVWIKMARQTAGFDEDLADHYERNARNQVTLWGPFGEINDYAAKHWNGLMGDYYMRRWALFFSFLSQSIATQIPPNWSLYDAELLSIGQQFSNSTTPTYPSEPFGDTIEVSRRLLRKYSSTAYLLLYTQHSNVTAVYINNHTTPCSWSAPLSAQYLAGCTSDGCVAYSSLSAAEDACQMIGCGCGGVTQAGNGGGYWTTRAGNDPMESPSGEVSYLKTPICCDYAGPMYNAWSKDLGQLGFLCDSDPACAGFTSSGDVFAFGTFEMASQPGTDLYLKHQSSM